MNWPVLVIVSWAALVLEMALSPVLAAGRPDAGVVPGIVLPLVVFVAMHAGASTAMWYAIAMGVAMDLLGPVGSGRGEAGAGTVVSLGPMATAYLASIYVVLQIRSTVVRKNPLSLVALTIIAGVLVSIVSVSIVSVRSLYSEPAGFSLASELARRLAGALYTGVPALAMAIPLTRWSRVFGFQDPGAKRFTRRS